MSGRPSPSKITRRAALGTAALAGTSLLLRPPTGLADVVKPDPAVFSRAVGSLSGESAELNSGRRFGLVGEDAIALDGPASGVVPKLASLAGRGRPSRPSRSIRGS